MSRAMAVSIRLNRMGRPVSMHWANGVSAGKTVTSSIGKATSHSSGLTSATPTASRRIATPPVSVSGNSSSVTSRAGRRSRRRRRTAGMATSISSVAVDPSSSRAADPRARLVEQREPFLAEVGAHPEASSSAG